MSKTKEVMMDLVEVPVKLKRDINIMPGFLVNVEVDAMLTEGQYPLDLKMHNTELFKTPMVCLKVYADDGEVKVVLFNLWSQTAVLKEGTEIGNLVVAVSQVEDKKEEKSKKEKGKKAVKVSV